MSFIDRRALLGTIWNTSDHEGVMLCNIVPQEINPDELDELEAYSNSIRSECLATTKPWRLEARVLDFKKRTIWPHSSIEKDLRNKIIDEGQAKWRRQYGTWETARAFSKLVVLSEVVDHLLDANWSGASKDPEAIESASHAYLAARLRQFLPNPVHNF